MVNVQSTERGALARDADVAVFVGLGGALIVAGGFVAAINSAAPFTHGSWLAAYLVLVGGVAQIALGAGRLALGVPAAPARLRRLQLIGWNVGNAAVMGGVLAGSLAVVVVGSVPLLAALGGFAVGVRAAWRRARGLTLAYSAFVLMLAVSVVIGCVLADGTSTGAT